MPSRRKDFHEIRDPLHVFMRMDSDERRVLDSRPLQRLRHIDQLALSSLVYPGATHKRFEHSLGVMELAGRVFGVVTAPENVSDEVREVVPGRSDQLAYWRRSCGLRRSVTTSGISRSRTRPRPNSCRKDGITSASQGSCSRVAKCSKCSTRSRRRFASTT